MLMGFSHSVDQSFETAMIAKINGVPETNNVMKVHNEKGAENVF